MYQKEGEEVEKDNYKIHTMCSKSWSKSVASCMYFWRCKQKKIPKISKRITKVFTNYLKCLADAALFSEFKHGSNFFVGQVLASES